MAKVSLRPAGLPWLVGCLLIASAASAQVTETSRNPTSLKEIKVGVRAKLPPFSYRVHADDKEEGSSAADPENRSSAKGKEKRSSERLSDYGGFSIRVCQRVLEHMAGSGIFKDYVVKAVEVGADNREGMLRKREVDLLCGADSITATRLLEFNASYPIYISGVSYAYPRSFPRGQYCGAVLGFVKATTTEDVAPKLLAERNLLLRFDEEVEKHISKVAEFSPRDFPSAVPAPKPEGPGHSSGLAEEKGRGSFPRARGATANCLRGYPQSPIVRFSDHASAVTALCDGELLYYVGDIDIVRHGTRAQSAKTRCDVTIERYTLTREIYAVLMRRALDDSREPSQAQFDAMLFAAFNSSLVQLLQTDPNPLEEAFFSEFKGETMSSELRRLFDSLKIGRAQAR